MVRTTNRRFVFVGLTAILLLALPMVASAQGRGRGWGRGGRDQSDRTWNGWGRNDRDQNWKCGKFVNCHDARDGRIDGRGPNRTSGIWQNGVFYPRGTNTRYGRGRYSTNDYWRRRHVMNDDDNWRNNDHWRRRHVMNDDNDWRNNDYWRRRRITNDTWNWDNNRHYRNRRWRER